MLHSLQKLEDRLKKLTYKVIEVCSRSVFFVLDMANHFVVIAQKMTLLLDTASV
jgi:hypothetical protein